MSPPAAKRNLLIACKLIGMSEHDDVVEHPTDERATDPTSEIDIEAGASDVWHALTTDDGLAGWLGDGATIEPEHQGELVAPDPVGGTPRRGIVDDIEPEQRIGFTWWPETDPHDRSFVTITLEPVEVGTRVRVVERPLVIVGAVDATAVTHRAMWAWRGATLQLAACRVSV